MVLANGLLRIFWPSDVLSHTGQGTLVGWRNSPFDVFIVAVLQDVEVKSQKDYWSWSSLTQLRRGRLKVLFELVLFCEIARTQYGRYTIYVETARCMS